MPRRPSGYREHGTVREQFVDRMVEEMERQGSSDSGLAKRVSANYPMSAATVWKIRKGTPPKRVDLDEAHAIAKACGFESVEAFLIGDEGRHGVVLIEMFRERTQNMIESVARYAAIIEPEPGESRNGDPDIYYAKALDFEALSAARQLPTEAYEVNRVQLAMMSAIKDLGTLQLELDRLSVPDLIEVAERSLNRLDEYRQLLVNRMSDAAVKEHNAKFWGGILRGPEDSNGPGKEQKGFK